ncbi:MAG: hypothetical protein MUP66_01395 [Candidatus Nanohaloarchaeota archaeon QJJ-5]|nr:hypothetical protein [Candidatus Nanohaloarchaeota archaeon QJJ-5]
MAFHLKQNDYLVMGVLAVLAGIAGYSSLMAENPLLVEQWLDRVTVLVVLSAVVIIYKAKQQFDDEIARELELIGVGLTVYMLVYLPHIIWHISDQPSVPIASFTVPGGFLYGFFHMLSISAFILVAYGFYNLWVTKREA